MKYGTCCLAANPTSTVCCSPSTLKRFSSCEFAAHASRHSEADPLYLGDGAWAVEPRTVPAPGTVWWLEKAEGRNHVREVNLRANGTAAIRAVDIDGKQFDKVELWPPRTKPVD